MPSWMSLNFQDSCSLAMAELSCLHDHVMVVMLGVIIVISYILIFILVSSKTYKFLSEGTFIETIWSVIPAFLLIILVVPSMSTLYLMEESQHPSFSFKIIAHQWYWTYVSPFINNAFFKCADEVFSNFEVDSLMEEFTSSSSFPRLLGCNQSLFLPVGVISRFMLTSTDVIHSFAVPSLGLKLDAVPGRINQMVVTPGRVGMFYGQCSEICGSYHSFMPISVKVCDFLDYSVYSLSFVSSDVGD